jgi:hypothetical protein
MSAMSWQFVAATKASFKKDAVRSRNKQMPAMRCSRSAVDECNFVAADVARIGLGDFLQPAFRGRANRPPPADAIQSVMIIGSAI